MPSDVRGWAALEQEFLWDDLHRAINRSRNGVWCMEASSLAQRIVAAAVFVGPTDPRKVPWRLVAGGVYDAILFLVGPYEPVGPEYLERAERYMQYHGGRVMGLRAIYALTVEAMLTEADDLRDLT